MNKFYNKVIWITGASSGIGEALAYELAKKGARLILSARRKEELERVKGNCIAKTQPNVRTLPMDLSESQTLKLCTQAAIQLFGQVDMLINCAGITQRGFAKDTLPEVDRKIMEINYFGPITVTKYLLPHFLKRKTGHIVIISSITGKFGTPYRSGYAASKHALHGFFDSLRAELWKEVKNAIPVTLICPGFVKTPITLSAVTADGSPLNKIEEGQYKGMPAGKFARLAIKAIQRKKREVYIGGTETIGVNFKRWFPGWFSRYIRKAKVR